MQRQTTTSRRQMLGSTLVSAAAIALAPLAKAQPGKQAAARNSAVPPAVDPQHTFDGTWPFQARYSEAPGFRMHYVEEGTGAETLLLLHGEPTWGYLFRNQIPLWAQNARVIAVDHMGFGKSAAPQRRTYWLQDHIDNLERFVLSRDLRGLTLVMHDFGGPVGMGLAIRHPDRIKRIVSVNGPTPLGQPDLIERLTANAAIAPWFQWILKAEANGTLESVLGQLDYNILSTLKLNGFERNEIITDTWLAAYRAPFPTPRHAAGAIGWAKGFATGIHQFEAPEAVVAAALAEEPALALWATLTGPCMPTSFCPCSARLSRAARCTALPAPGTTARRMRPSRSVAGSRSSSARCDVPSRCPASSGRATRRHAKPCQLTQRP